MVHISAYDAIGREVKKYLPYIAGDNTGVYKEQALNDQNVSASDEIEQYHSGAQFEFYQTTSGVANDLFPYSENIMEASPLNRPLKIFGPGSNWRIYDKPQNFQYLTNINGTSAGQEKIICWIINSSGYPERSSTFTSGYYPNSRILVKVLSDEEGNVVREYNTMDGKLILKKMQVKKGATNLNSTEDWLHTYYIYDDYGQLRYALQPLLVKLVMQNDSNNPSTADLSELAFCYSYDDKGRMTMKKLPGSGKVYMVYDARGRIVLTQDSVRRAAHQWLYTQYDELNRPKATGLMNDETHYNNRSYHQSNADTSVIYPVAATYSIDTLTKTFYDDYQWRSGQGNPLSNSRNTDSDGHLVTPSNSTWPYAQNATTQNSALMGMVTGTKTKVLGTNEYLYSIIFYDDKSRIIQSQSQNISTGTDIANIQYTWIGKPLLTIYKNEKLGVNAQSTILLTKLNYDSAGRLLSTEKKIGNSLVNGGNIPGSWTKISENEYDLLGQVRKKKLGVAPIDSLIYDYNIRGWLLGANRDYAKSTVSTAHYFGFDMGYDQTSLESLGNYSGVQWNGNVSGIVWKSTGDDEVRKYDFSYDGLKRLKGAEFSQYTSGFNKNAGIDFSVSGLTYDPNGNILSMNQKGWTGTNSSTIDSLLYVYNSNSNRLHYVYDRTNNSSSKLGDFKESLNAPTQDYLYDVNGNLIYDENKGIEEIYYNYLSLPIEVGFGDRGIVDYTYDALGNKLKKVVRDFTSSFTTTTIYQGGAVYRNDTLEFVGMEEGRIRYDVAKASLEYDYMIKDHLGNVRMVLTEQKDTSVYPEVKHETTTVGNEDGYYENVYLGRTARPASFYNSTTNGDTVQLLRQSTNKIGAGKLLKVMAKDKLHIKVDYYTPEDVTNNDGADGLGSILSLFTTLINNSAVTNNVHGSGSTITSNLNSSTPFTSFMGPQNGAGGTSMPKAYLNVIFLDEQFRFVPTNSESVQVATKGNGQTITRISGSAKEAVKNGYVYIYVSNESNNMVYFDNLQVTHEKGAILEESHFYPFGLTMAGISSRAAGGLENKYKFGGKELQSDEFSDNSGLELYDFGARQLDPQIGRWTTIDPLADKFAHQSTYVAMDNNPSNIIDPTGMSGTSTHTDKNGKVIAVYKDGDLGVYKHADNANGKAPTEANIDKRHSKSTSAGGEKMGETENWDEFVSPETQNAYTETVIQFGKSFDPFISEMHERAKSMDLIDVARESGPGGDFDIKKDFKNVGGLLNGKYATSRSAGNFLAGYNAQSATYLGAGISFTTFQMLAGALHIEGDHHKKLGKGQMLDIVVFGKYASSDHSRFVPPTYGEVNYQYRMSLSGWNFGTKK